MSFSSWAIAFNIKELFPQLKGILPRNLPNGKEEVEVESQVKVILIETGFNSLIWFYINFVQGSLIKVVLKHIEIFINYNKSIQNHVSNVGNLI